MMLTKGRANARETIVTSENLILENQKQETMIPIYILQKSIWNGKIFRCSSSYVLGIFGKILLVYPFKISYDTFWLEE